VDRTLFRPDRRERTAEPSVLFVGSMDGRKRGRFLLEGFLNRICPQHPTATLTIVGAEGPSHPGVEYLTGVADARLADLYRRSWVFASPSSYEGFGLPYLEAMACGTPVVATRNPGSVEVLGNGAYGLMPPDSEFARSVADLLEDETGRAVLTAAGLKRADEYSLDRMLDGYEQMLMDMSALHARTVASA
jgi:phosphatidyl-myo-inositol alpha-mannosyltransferase